MILAFHLHSLPLPIDPTPIDPTPTERVQTERAQAIASAASCGCQSAQTATVPTSLLKILLEIAP